MTQQLINTCRYHYTVLVWRTESRVCWTGSVTPQIKTFFFRCINYSCLLSCWLWHKFWGFTINRVTFENIFKAKQFVFSLQCGQFSSHKYFEDYLHTWSKKVKNADIPQGLNIDENWLIISIITLKLKYFGHLKSHSSFGRNWWNKEGEGTNQCTCFKIRIISWYEHFTAKGWGGREVWLYYKVGCNCFNDVTYLLIGKFFNKEFDTCISEQSKHLTEGSLLRLEQGLPGKKCLF